MSNRDPETLVLNSSTSTTDYYGGCECAVLEISPHLLDTVRKRIKIAMSAFQDDGSLWELSFASQDVEFYDSDLVATCDEVDVIFMENFEKEGVARLPDSVARTDFEPAPTECDEMVLRIIMNSLQDVQTEIAWRVFPKHSDTLITTYAVSLEELQRHDQKASHPERE